MSEFSKEQIEQAAQTSRWNALAQLGVVADDLNRYVGALIREPRLLVPVDVQALVIDAGNVQTPFVRLPFRESEDFPPFDVHDPGTTRPPGVHLLWSVPAALGRGRVVDDPAAPGDATRRKLDLPLLPDRWVVVRLAVPSGAQHPLVRGWVVEAETATVT